MSPGFPRSPKDPKKRVPDRVLRTTKGGAVRAPVASASGARLL